MYRTAYQRGMLTVFFSGGSKPLEIWDKQTKDGYIKRFLDQEIKTMVMEIRGTNISTTYIICPKGNQVLGIHMPFLVMVVKNLNKYFSFEVTVLDDTGTRRRFRVSNFQSTTQILPLCTVMPIGLSDGWNQIQFNLAEFTRRAYKKEFQEVQKLKINANIRLRRIYFTERLMNEDELPPEYKLYFPLQSKKADKKASDQTAPKISKTDIQQSSLPTDNLAVIKPPEEAMQKVASVEKVVILQKAVSSEKIPSVEKVPATEKVPSADNKPSAEAASGTEEAPAAGEEETLAVKEASNTENAPGDQTEPPDDSTAGDTAPTTTAESTVGDVSENPGGAPSVEGANPEG